MAINGLDHVNILTDRFDETVAFYQDILGLGRLPAASATGRRLNAWLGVGEAAVIHVNGVVDAASPAAMGTGGLDHFALRGDDIASFRRQLETSGLEYVERRLEGRPLRQIVVLDPNGIKVEIVFDDDGHLA